MTGGIFGLPRWLTGVTALVAIYCAVMLAAALWMPHELDWVVYEWVSVSNPPTFSDNVRIVDVPWDREDVAANRRYVTSFLGGILGRRQTPSAVIFDIQFIRCQTKPCGAVMDTARARLVATIRAATKQFAVYATEEVSPERGSDEVTTPRDPHDPLIYGALSGAGHTVLPLPFPQARVAFYRRCYADVPFLADDGVTVAGHENIWSMADRVLIPADKFLGLACDTSHVAVRLGPKFAGADPHVAAVTKVQDLNNKYVIVGTLAVDRPAEADRSGPEILGWALSNALESSSRVPGATSYATIPQNGVLLLLIPAFSGVAVIIFMAAFYGLRRARLKKLRYGLPWIAAGIAAIVSLGLFVGFEAWMLYFHEIQPQVALIAMGIVLASGLSGIRGSQTVLEDANAPDMQRVEKYDHDVFISYAHEDLAWVVEHVYMPFKNARLSNGKPLQIFFDTDSIPGGAAWQDNICIAMDASKVILLVYSETYFARPYCKFEARRALRKWITEGPETGCVLPVVRGNPNVPAWISDIQHASVDERPDLVEGYVNEVVERLSRSAGTTSGPASPTDSAT
ncbi:MAG TPA: toll/interleukin-1 receptor domain-containing protein [Verrucomicrobiae bacterium]|jgi:hypothetical protein|nr:toll/interleukin-1 receptor domain-containing protein [Verrucomicrobiae bacterium]